MTHDEARFEAARRLMAMAEDSIQSARREQTLGPATAVNRAYYACFYSASAVLIFEGHRYTRHKGVRSGLHKHLIQTARIPESIGKRYDEAMNTRHSFDYEALLRCTPEDAANAIENAEAIMQALKRLLPREALPDESV